MSAIYSLLFFNSYLICFRILCDLQHSRDESNRWFYARLCNNERLSYQISLPWSIQMYAFCFKDFFLKGLLYQFHRKLRNIFLIGLLTHDFVFQYWKMGGVYLINNWWNLHFKILTCYQAILQHLEFRRYRICCI